MAYKTITPASLIDKFSYALSNKWGYIWGTAGVEWTQAKQDALDRTTDSDRATSRKYGAKWIGHMVADCSGLFSWAFKQLGSYMYHGSNTMWNKYCTAKGKLVKGKRDDGAALKPGTAVFTYKADTGIRGHVGLYVGDNTVIEAAGTVSGVTTTKITNSKWNEWGELKYVDYSDNTVSEVKETARLLRFGCKGLDVKHLQQLLIDSGYLGNGADDGIFGPKTLQAVKDFQASRGLKVDGLAGPDTMKALEQLEKTTVYTVTISGLHKDEAELLKKAYPMAVIS